MRSAHWQPARRRHRRRLGPCEVTLHALDSFLTRHPGADRATAREQLEAICREAYWVGTTPTGSHVYKGEACRLIVHRPARRLPILLTVLEGHE